MLHVQINLITNSFIEYGRRKAAAMPILFGYPMKKSAKAPHYSTSEAPYKTSSSFRIYNIRIRVRRTLILANLSNHL
jgi:hypothetical protein